MNNKFLRHIYFLITTFLVIEVITEGTAIACDSVGTFCSDDCTSLVLCTQQGAQGDELPCSVVGNGHPFCKEIDETSASCSADSNKECEGLTSDVQILCAQSGELPHPLDCTKSVICKESDGSEPHQNCLCSEGSYLQINTIGMPCKTTEPSNCKKSYADVCPKIPYNNHFEGSEYWMYSCKEDGSILVYGMTKDLEIVFSDPVKTCTDIPQSSSEEPSSPPQYHPYDHY